MKLINFFNLFSSVIKEKAKKFVNLFNTNKNSSIKTNLLIKQFISHLVLFHLKWIYFTNKFLVNTSFLKHNSYLYFQYNYIQF
ncbi:Uncharacterised protein [Mesomycoplasma conjunctivae]|uniref:Uncharacterized protein n=1 Tax=Mesomycoplasma conjunctivae (strain ATCC 25834 / NCTC 10147 / HRC/581) TaxID=572263 RepID=C5J700_MESCH|nr:HYPOTHETICAL PROTEIN MCJ_005640 [Mesomycoplasma conjunctivae]VEU66493.1 Uncharacterised protein [Mesomycoplasma conjunctivae]